MSGPRFFTVVCTFSGRELHRTEGGEMADLEEAKLIADREAARRKLPIAEVRADGLKERPVYRTWP